MAPPPVGSSRLEGSLLKALGELFVVVVELSDLVRGRPSGVVAEEHVDHWRAAAAIALDDAERIARGASMDARTPEIIVVCYRDGSSAAIGRGAVQRAAEHLTVVLHSGKAIGMTSPGQ